MATVTLSESRAVQVPVDEAFDRVLVHPLPEIFRRRGASRSRRSRTCAARQGEWGTVGETRTIVTSRRRHHARDAHVRTTVRTASATRSRRIRGPMKPLVSSRRRTAGPSSRPATGTRITWTWVLTPTPVGRVAMPAFASDVARLCPAGARRDRSRPAQVSRTRLGGARGRVLSFQSPGGVAQLVARLVRIEKARGSSPLTSTRVSCR